MTSKKKNRKVSPATENPQEAKSGDGASENNPGEDRFGGLFDPLGANTVQALNASSFENVEALAEALDGDIVAIKGIGQRALEPIRGILADAGFERPNKFPEDESLEKATKKPMSNTGPQPQSASRARSANVVEGGLRNKKDGKIRATRFLVYSWEGKEYTFSIDDELDPKIIPASLIEEMLQRGEAKRT